MTPVLRLSRRTVAAVLAGSLTASAAVFVGPAAPSFADTSPGPSVADIKCQPEQFPHGGAPRSSAFTPYEIPFTATLGPDPAPAGVFPTKAQPTPMYPPDAAAPSPEGGYLSIFGKSQLLKGATVTVTLGGPVVNGKGNIYARSCGVLQLPNQTGGIGADRYVPIGTGGEYNPNFEFAPDTPVSISIMPSGITLPALPGAASPIVAFGESDGFLASDIQPVPAPNGGMDLDFYATAKSTTNLSALLSSPELLTVLKSVLPPSALPTATGPANDSDCTVAIGDLATAGVPVPPGGIGGLSYADATRSVHLTTKTSGAYTGQPVTGPIAPNAQGRAQDTATLVSNDFPIAAILPQMPPAQTAPPGASCSSSNANLLNQLIGLPTKPGQAVFVAPSTFGVYTSS